MLLEQTFLSEHDYYEVMGLSPEATVLDIEAAFKQQAAGLDLRHPNPETRMQAAEKMLILTQAYEALSDPMLRSHYDRQVLGRNQMPVTPQVDGLFKEGLRAWRKGETDMALRYLKEVANLYPHRSLYRVHLAIAYADKDWFAFTESELETALRLDPDSGFAKETVAKLLFKLPDKRRYWHQNPLNRQVAMLAAGFVGLAVLFASGLPQNLASGLIAKVTDATRIQSKQPALEDRLPEDMRKELAKKQTTQQREIPFFESDYKPEGKTYDYTKLEAKSKVFYPEQQMVVLTYKDGSILTYKPASIKGWQKRGELPVIITENNELIPSPTSLPVLMPDMKPANLEAADFPAWMFPEYGIAATPPSSVPSGNDTSPAEPADSTTDTNTDTAAEPPASSPPAETPTAQPASPTGGYNPYGN
ncbi:MAG: J domain-containing protein [Candidatus Sericytochromatia bacterium]|nr:J domain-containing protein [Candidatus Sericytochromatia bacterium]